MKTFTFAFLLVFGSGFSAGRVSAQEAAPVIIEGQSPPTTSLLNIGDFLHAMRVGYGIDQHGKKSEIYYTAIYEFHNSAGVSFASFNVGYEGVGRHPTLMTGIRLDNMLPLLWSGAWGKKHVTTAKLPTFEFGPFVSIWPKSSDNLWKMDFKYGVGGAIGF